MFRLLTRRRLQKSRVPDMFSIMKFPQHPFAAGLTLSQLSAVSCDGEWVPTFIHDEAETIHKVSSERVNYSL